MKTSKRNRNNKRTEIERFDWFIERIQTRVAFKANARVKKLHACKLSRNQSIIRFDVILQHDWPIDNRTMPSSFKGFLWRENEESMFRSFHPLADKTNNVHLPKPFFKVIRKSLYTPYAESLTCPHLREMTLFIEQCKNADWFI